MVVQTVFSSNLNPTAGSISDRFTGATAFYINAPLLGTELEIDVFLQIYIPIESGERTRNLALGKLKDGQITLNQTDTETIVSIPQEIVNTGLEMALFFIGSDSTYLEAYAICPKCTNCDLENKLDELSDRLSDIESSGNNIDGILSLILEALDLVVPLPPVVEPVIDALLPVVLDATPENFFIFL